MVVATAKKVAVIVPGIVLSLVYARFMHDLHENTLWFSNIQEVEREISFRTESGLYYSFYKALVQAESFWDGLLALTKDTLTEYPHQINVLQRFNIYPEVLLSLCYRGLGSWLNVSPIMFYVYCSFLLSGLSVFMVYLLALEYTGSWMQASMASVWMLVNYEDTSRVNFAVNMREVYALPGLWLQVLSIFRSMKARSPNRVLVVLSTFLFAVCWQFNQFVLILQAISLLALQFVCPPIVACVRELVLCQTAGYLLAVLVQFMQPMALQSHLFVLNMFIVASSYYVPPTFSLLKSSSYALLTMLLALLASSFLHSALFGPSDSHIWSFVAAKLGLAGDNVAFETALYLCHAAFGFTGYDFIERTSKNGAFQLFVIGSAATLFDVLKDWWYGHEQKPQYCLLLCKSALFGFLTFTTMRMKYVFVPLALVLASSVFSILDRLSGRFIKFTVISVLAFTVCNNHYTFYKKFMSHEQEFYDPDTVKLMQWIQEQPADSVFAGSMQLMAGVKCCTGRPITNHPHFEDKRLRERTFRIYQVYGRAAPDLVHRTLKAEQATHLILEDSLCLAKSTGCALKDLVDVANGVRTESGLVAGGRRPGRPAPSSSTARFCDVLRKSGHSLFSPVFRNRTFRVYRLV